MCLLLFALLALGWHSHWLCPELPCGLCKQGIFLHVSQPPSCENALPRLEFVFHSLLGIHSGKEDTFREHCPPKSAFGNGRPRSLLLAANLLWVGVG